MREDSIVFTSARIGQLEIKNRLVRSATYENAATSKGEVSDFLVNLYRTLAKGGVGLIITGTAGVYSKALAPHLVVRADDDSFIPSLEKIPRAVREVAPDCKVISDWGRVHILLLAVVELSSIKKLAIPNTECRLRSSEFTLSIRSRINIDIKLDYAL